MYHITSSNYDCIAYSAVVWDSGIARGYRNLEGELANAALVPGGATLGGADGGSGSQ